MVKARELLTSAELAQRLRVSRSAVSKWRRAGQIPVVQLSTKIYRFNFEEVVQALSTRSHGRCAAS